MADTDADGKMNINEFSIACKLINLKLRGFEIPKILPPALIASLSVVSGTPTRTPTSGMSPSVSVGSIGAPVHAAGPPPVPPQPAILQQQQQQQMQYVAAAPIPQRPPQPIIPSQPLIQAGQPIMTAPIPPAIPPQPSVLPQAIVPPMTQQPQQMIQQPLVQPMSVQPQVMPGVVPMQQPVYGAFPQQHIPQQVPQNLIQTGVEQQGIIPPPVMAMAPVQQQQPAESQSLLGGFTSAPTVPQIPQQIPQQIPVQIPQQQIPQQIPQQIAPQMPQIPALPTPPGSGTQSRSMSISERAPSIESP